MLVIFSLDYVLIFSGMENIDVDHVNQSTHLDDQTNNGGNNPAKLRGMSLWKVSKGIRRTLLF